MNPGDKTQVRAEYQEAYIRNMEEIGAERPDIALWIQQLRLNMDHRGITGNDIAAEVGRSREWVSMRLRGARFSQSVKLKNGVRRRFRSPVSYEAMEAGLDLIDAAIDRITEHRASGGQRPCCTLETRREIAKVLATPAYYTDKELP